MTKYKIILGLGDYLIFDTENPYNEYNFTHLGWDIKVEKVTE